MGWTVDAGELDQLAEAMQQFGEGSGQIVDEVLHGEGAEEIKQRIAGLLPASGRTWRGKAAPARSVMPGQFKQDNESQAVTIVARGKYGYLYFPDDGSNTRRHAGNQRFMERGAEAAADRVIDLCLGRLVDAFQ